MKKNSINYETKIGYIYRFIRKALFILAASVVLASCGSTKDATYFFDTPDTQFTVKNENLEPIIQENDLLSITVSSINPEAAEMFNKANISEAQTANAVGNVANISGYLVDQDGFIRFPVLGKIKSAGKTKKALREEITSILDDRKLLIDPIVDIRYLNYKVSVLGEVKNPTVLTVPSEKISIFEALGLAGDITIYGVKENVVIIREEAGIKKLSRVDLTTDEIFSSPYYYLKSNDVVYVEANKTRISSSSQATLWVPVLLSAISLGIVAIVNFK
ncbi:polysaccharide biosynthesis/export family protein [Aurantibacter crassamenti]|uniref:polysaccharide biosynthesis/export family protein n=1 Tax=Aurantibacter crassamenti TaxID=1837375 RepID=UPI001939F5B6|nr:polysaccharide biosynthesis/export family protein [Aurantibacter crassamenti]MBM1105822.1 polysaccharide biosynthesis/export family protein [Aurantibacter crassamenti]